METNRANISFGRSIYINLGEQVVTQVLEEMKAARQTVAFTSFQLPEHPLEIADMTHLVELARSYEVDLIPDIAHKDLTKENIAALKNAGLSYLRLDEFGDEAFIERCGKAFTLVVNASTFTNQEYQLLERLGLSKSLLATIIIQKYIQEFRLRNSRRLIKNCGRLGSKYSRLFQETNL